MSDTQEPKEEIDLKERKKAYGKKRYTCECGVETTKRNISVHNKTVGHLEYMAKKDNIFALQLALQEKEKIKAKIKELTNKLNQKIERKELLESQIAKADKIISTIQTKILKAK